MSKPKANFSRALSVRSLFFILFFLIFLSCNKYTAAFERGYRQGFEDGFKKCEEIKTSDQPDIYWQPYFYPQWDDTTIFNDTIYYHFPKERIFWKYD
jgi:hypothetical protein